MFVLRRLKQSNTKQKQRSIGKLVCRQDKTRQDIRQDKTRNEFLYLSPLLPVLSFCLAFCFVFIASCLVLSLVLSRVKFRVYEICTIHTKGIYERTAAQEGISISQEWSYHWYTRCAFRYHFLWLSWLSYLIFIFFVLCRFELSYILSCLVIFLILFFLWCLVWSCLVLSFLPCPVLSLSCLVFCWDCLFVSYCLVLPCLVWSCLKIVLSCLLFCPSCLVCLVVNLYCRVLSQACRPPVSVLSYPTSPQHRTFWIGGFCFEDQVCLAFLALAPSPIEWYQSFLLFGVSVSISSCSSLAFPCVVISLRCVMLPCLVFWCDVFSCLSCLVLSCFVVSCPLLSCLAFSCRVLSSFSLAFSGSAFPCLVLNASLIEWY